MLVEGEQFAPDTLDVLHFLHQYAIEVADVLLNVGARLVHFVQQHHFLLHQVNHVVDVVSVAADESFFLLKDLLFKEFRILDLTYL